MLLKKLYEFMSSFATNVEREGSTDSIESNVLGGPVIGSGNVAWSTVVILVPKWGLLTIKPIQIQDG